MCTDKLSGNRNVIQYMQLIWERRSAEILKLIKFLSSFNFMIYCKWYYCYCCNYYELHLIRKQFKSFLNYKNQFAFDVATRRAFHFFLGGRLKVLIAILRLISRIDLINIEQLTVSDFQTFFIKLTFNSAKYKKITAEKSRIIFIFAISFLPTKEYIKTFIF